MCIKYTVNYNVCFVVKLIKFIILNDLFYEYIHKNFCIIS